jgi:N-sulfoglucosamine sulfohydrolase
MWRAIATAGLLLAGCPVRAPAASTPRPPAGPRPNILFLISDDHSAGDLGVAGNAAVRTPALDALAREGVRFERAYAVSPQCSPSRAAMVSGRSPHATGTSRLHATLRAEHDTIVDALARAGYFVASYRKVHLGEAFQSRWNFVGGPDRPFEDFFRERPRDRPFYLWIGFEDPHRPYAPGAVSPPHDPATVVVPPFLPDTPAVRADLATYYDEIARMDGEVAHVLALLEREGLARDTLVVFAGDNGMPFPGAKGSLTEAGVRVPLLARWPGRIAPGVRPEIVSLLDLAPTFLAVAGLPPLPSSEGQSLLPVLTGASGALRQTAVFERNWHDTLDFIRGIRSGRWLLVQNYRPELAYKPTLDLEGSPSWRSIVELHQRGTLPAALAPRYFGVRSEVELYDVDADPGQLHDVAVDPAHAGTIRELQKAMSDWMVATNDFLPPPIQPALRPQGEGIHAGH